MSWEIKITPKNIEKKTARVSATRTDDTTGETFTTATDAVLDTTANKTAALDAIWSDWQNYQTKQSEIASVIGTMEADGKANLEARE